MTRDKSIWQRRAMAAGLKQWMLVNLTGHDKTTVSRQLRGYWKSGIPAHVRSVIIAWEIMTPEQRLMWLRHVEDDLEASEAPDERKLPPGEQQ